jgi:hypothetical protein
MATASIPDIDAETERALTRFVMNCPELSALEALLSRFNIFRILRAAHHEIRHSNMLAWLLTPDESHGLRDRFFRRLLVGCRMTTLRRTMLNRSIELSSMVGKPLKRRAGQFFKQRFYDLTLRQRGASPRGYSARNAALAASSEAACP